jgi:tRNA A-37 threonylcarbamoyl transferase component Bud32
VWIWRRLLELLGWIHENGVVHCRVRPEHVLLHPRDHGVVLVGWSHAARRESVARSADDIVASAESLRHVLGGSLPAPLEAVVHAAERGARSDASTLSAEVREAAREAFGPARYHPFTMPDRRV